MVKQRKNHINLGSFPVKFNKDGNRICQICDKVLNSRQTKYCSSKCQSEMFVSNSHPYLKTRVVKERGTKCEKCGIECGMEKNLILDHKIPIALGGEEFSKENVWLLCKGCNKIKTKIDAGNIAKLRVKEKMIRKGQRTL